MRPFQPDFEQMLKVLRREVPERPVLFELYMNMPLYEQVNGRRLPGDDQLTRSRFIIEAFRNMGYDYATLYTSSFRFTHDPHELKTHSLNEGEGLVDEANFERFVWPEPEDFDSSHLGKVAPDLPEGMKLCVMGPGGILEILIALTGYDNLCLMLYDEPELVGRIVDEVGKRLVRYYETALQYDTVGFISSNDDWGFNTQTFLSPPMLRELIFPWHQKIVDTAHKAGRPVLLHSCGNLAAVMDDIIAMGYDAKHSFEDKIQPVEEAYEAFHSRIALLGGLDMDFMCKSSEQEVYDRAIKMLERTADRGGWALGTGNSVPEYLPPKNILALGR
ncbi:MAG: uroporphyrinogen decarboxylase family protein, partial [Eubacteriales bacterium]|nr:uroporphyrinogen decarboxylase family protein [Eubacteriales bacterium]